MKKKKKSTEEEVVFELSDEEGIEESTDKKKKKLQEELKTCQKERKEYMEGWQRAKADFINAKKDFELQKDSVGQYVKEGMLHELLLVEDSFNMAMKGAAWGKVDENWRKGVEYIHQQFVSILSNNGLTEIEALGKLFDPNEHISIESAPTEIKNEDGKVIEIIQSGYRLNGKVIRPVKVKVGKYIK